MIVNVDILNESVDTAVNSIYSKAVIFFEHTIKWKWYKNDSEEKYTSWINSIIEANKSIKRIIYLKNNKLYTNAINRSNDLLHKAYLDGIKAAPKKIKSLKSIDDKDEIYNDFNDVRLICDNEYLKKWLLKYTSYKYKDIVYKGFDDKDD